MKNINEIIQKLESLNDATCACEMKHWLIKQLKELQSEDQTGEDLIEYFDSTGRVINQPNVHLVDKKHGTSFPAIFRNGKFYNDKKSGEFVMEYDYAMKHYHVAMTGERIGCLRKCVFNRHDGCTIEPCLILSENLGNCQSEIPVKVF